MIEHKMTPDAGGGVNRSLRSLTCNPFAAPMDKEIRRRVGKSSPSRETMSEKLSAMKSVTTVVLQTPSIPTTCGCPLSYQATRWSVD